jgi:hypothetical protein
MYVGRAFLSDDLRLSSPVAGGGQVGPGSVSRHVDYDQTQQQRWVEDKRSSSKRSGEVVFQLQGDALYVLNGIATGSSSSGTFYLSTFGTPTKLTPEQFEAERARLWPLGKEAAEGRKALQARTEAARIQREAEEAERRRIAREALVEINEQRAAELVAAGQPDIGLPALSGTPKQIAYALEIRKAFAIRHPGDAALKRGKTAKYWIENHRSVLYR